ncbi:MAG: endo alpha-1,4 polygalactosaminidase, partial [bacterium]
MQHSKIPIILLGAVALFSCSRWFGKREGAPYRRLLPDHPISWVCYYGENSPDLSFDQYKLAVLEPDHHIPIKPLLSRGTKVLAYLSLGEIGNYRSYFKKAKEKGLLLKPVEHWEGSYAVKFSAPGWTEMLTEKLIPNLLREGYSGLFFDTVDSVVFEGYHPESKQKNIEKLKKLFKN